VQTGAAVTQEAGISILMGFLGSAVWALAEHEQIAQHSSRKRILFIVEKNLVVKTRGDYRQHLCLFCGGVQSGLRQVIPKASLVDVVVCGYSENDRWECCGAGMEFVEVCNSYGFGLMAVLVADIHRLSGAIFEGKRYAGAG